MVELFNALYRGDLKEAESLIRAGPVDHNCVFGIRTALDLACERGYANIAELLIQYGANVDLACGIMRPLGYACYKGHSHIVELLIKHKAQNLPNKVGCTPFMEVKSVEAALVMLNSGIVKDINEQDMYGRTVLSYICMRPIGNQVPELIEFLLKNGATNIPNHDGRTPFMYAYTKEVVRVMLNSGIVDDINRQDKCGKTALYYACLDGSDGVIKLLIKNGAEVVPAMDENFFWEAARSSRDEAMKFILERKIVTDINITNSKGYTALHCACSNNNKKLIKLLIENGANNTPNYYGNTPFTIAVLHEEVDEVKLMLERKLVIDIDNQYYRNGDLLISMMYLASNNNKMTELLIRYGVNIYGDVYCRSSFVCAIVRYQMYCKLNGCSVEYGLAMLNLLMRGAAIDEDLVAQNVMYRYAVDTAKVQKSCNSEQEMYDMIYKLREKKIVEYINNPFISARVQNKLLLNACVWYERSCGTYRLKELFDEIKNREELSDSLKIIRLGEEIFSYGNEGMMKGNEYSRHVYHMTMNAMEKYRKKEDRSLRYPEEVFQLAHRICGFGKYSEDMPNLKMYAKNLAKAHLKESWMLKELCLHYDNEKFDLFNHIKQDFNDLKIFHCVYNCTEYEILKSCIEAYYGLKGYFCNMTEAHVEWNCDDNELRYNLAEFCKIKECGRKIHDLKEWQNLVYGINDWKQKYEHMKDAINNAQDSYQTMGNKNIWSVEEFVYFLKSIGAIDINECQLLDADSLFHSSHFDCETINNIMELYAFRWF